MGKYDALMAYGEDKTDKYNALMNYQEPAAQPSRSLGSQLGQRAENIGDAVTGKPIYGSDNVGVPARAVRVGGQVSGGIGDIIGAGVDKVIDLIPDRAKQAVGGAVRKVGDIQLPLVGDDGQRRMQPIRQALNLGGLAQGVAKSYEDVPQGEKEFFGDLINTADLVLGGAGAAKSVSKAGGDLIESAGKSGMRSAIKIRDVTARKAGRSVDEGVENIVNNIAKHKVQSTAGGIKGIANNARSKIDALTSQTDNLIRQFAEQNPNARVDVESIMLQYMDDLANAQVPGLRVNGENAAELVDKTYKALEKSGLGGMQTVDKIPEIKKFIRQEFDIFGRGPMNIGDDAFKAQVADHAYLRMKDALDEAIPEMRQIGSDMRELIEIEDAMGQAAKRIGNRDQIGLNDFIALFGGPGALQAMGVPAGVATTGALPGAFVIGRKAYSSGRGPSALISGGQALGAANRINRVSPSAAPLLLLPNAEEEKQERRGSR